MLLCRKRQGHRLRRKNTPETFYIGWLSDTHVLEQYIDNPELAGSGVGELKHFYSIGAKMRKFVDVMNSRELDMVVNTGDVVDSGSEFTWYNELWSQLTCSKKETIIGNHDLYDNTMEEFATALGYENRETIAGSKFNYSFELSKNEHSIKVIFFDSTNGNAYEGVCPSETRDWIASELADDSLKNVLIFTHHPPHRYADETPQFNRTDALALQSIIDSAVSSNPGLKIHTFFGHSHGNTHVITYNNLGDNFIGYLCSALVDYETNNFFIIKVTTDGHVSFETISASYPYV